MKAHILRLVDSVNAYPLFHQHTRYKATVFMMHHFCPSGAGVRGVVPTDLLDRCLKYLADSDYTVIALSEYIERLKHHSAFYKTVVFTVDDGYRDFYDCAYPVFMKYRMPAAVFLATDFIDRETPLWWDQIVDIVQRLDRSSLELKFADTSLSYQLGSAEERTRAAGELVEYCKGVPDQRRCETLALLEELDDGSEPLLRATKRPLTWQLIEEMSRYRIEFFPHTLTHPILARCDHEKVLREVTESKSRVEEKTGSAAQIFCYPNGSSGDFDAGVVTLLKKAGCVAAVTAEAGHDDSRNPVDLFRLKRYAFPGSLVGFKQLVSGLEAFKDRWR